MFVIKSYESVGPIQLGMSADELLHAVGSPVRNLKNRRSELDYQYPGFSVRLSPDGNRVLEVSLLPESNALFGEIDVFNSPDALSKLLQLDGNPYEYVGFVILLNLGIALTGFHDNDPSQKSVGVFERGRWEHLRSQFKKHVAFEKTT